MMRKTLLLVSAVLLLTAVIPPAALRSDAPALQISTSIRPVTRDSIVLLRRVHPGMFRCTARVFDESGRKLVLPVKDIVIGPGESDETEVTFEQFTITFRAKIAKALDRADTVVTVTRDGKVVSKQTSTVWLERETNALVPVK